MNDLLFLSHRIPYPPNKGDKIRSYRLFRYATERCRVHLGTFIDDPDDWQHQETVRAMCGGQTRFQKLNPTWNKALALRGLLRGEPLSLPYYRNGGMQQWVDKVLAENNIRRIVVYSSAAAQFVWSGRAEKARRVIDFVDVDSWKWDQYARDRRGVSRWIYRREAQTLLRYERALAKRFDASLFVSAAEAALFKELAPESESRIDSYVNGVDTDFFSPDRPYANPYGPEDAALVFTGAMDYWANVDAVCWFAQRVLPHIREQVPQVRFVIAGGKAVPEVRKLATLPGVWIAGAVPDMRPFLAHAHAAMVPMRIARGIQNKILEAMAMGRPVIATGAAMEGIQLCPGLEQWVANDPEALARCTVTLLQGPQSAALRAEAGARGRACVLERHDWGRNLAKLGHILEI